MVEPVVCEACGNAVPLRGVTVETLQRLILAMAERIEVQSRLLSRCAERKAVNREGLDQTHEGGHCQGPGEERRAARDESEGVL